MAQSTWGQRPRGPQGAAAPPPTRPGSPESAGGGREAGWVAGLAVLPPGRGNAFGAGAR